MVDEEFESESEELDDEELDEDEVEDEDESADDADEDEDEAEKPKAKDKSEKRIRDLQSSLDKALAEVSKLKKGATGDKPEGKRPRDPEVERWVSAARDATLSRVYDSDPLFKELGIDRNLITGDTPDELEASAKQLSKLVTRIATRTRNKVLREHGFSPEPKGSGAEPRRNFGTMPDEEFQKLVKSVSGM